jgi:hypothetical protein
MPSQLGELFGYIGQDGLCRWAEKWACFPMRGATSPGMLPQRCSPTCASRTRLPRLWPVWTVVVVAIACAETWPSSARKGDSGPDRRERARGGSCVPNGTTVLFRGHDMSQTHIDRKNPGQLRSFSIRQVLPPTAMTTDQGTGEPMSCRCLHHRPDVHDSHDTLAQPAGPHLTTDHQAGWDK